MLFIGVSIGVVVGFVLGYNICAELYSNSIHGGYNCKQIESQIEKFRDKSVEIIDKEINEEIEEIAKQIEYQGSMLSFLFPDNTRHEPLISDLVKMIRNRKREVM